MGEEKVEMAKVLVYVDVSKHPYTHELRIIGRRQETRKICLFVTEKLIELRQGEFWVCVVVEEMETYTIIDPIKRVSGRWPERVKSALSPDLARLLVKAIQEELCKIKHSVETVANGSDLYEDLTADIDYYERALKVYENQAEAGINEVKMVDAI